MKEKKVSEWDYIKAQVQALNTINRLAAEHYSNLKKYEETTNDQPERE